MKKIKQMYSSIDHAPGEEQIIDHAVICEEKKATEKNLKTIKKQKQ
ncbi:hypothetical protein LVD15_09980 [Fulvivirga maritima]|nr:hypothetical protein [Fulvivirga maritima]UII28730.1 hypothetical protein LVD15_09980 [Fulvivirga maritima]